MMQVRFERIFSQIINYLFTYLSNNPYSHNLIIYRWLYWNIVNSEDSNLLSNYSRTRSKSEWLTLEWMSSLVLFMNFSISLKSIFSSILLKMSFKSEVSIYKDYIWYTFYLIWSSTSYLLAFLWSAFYTLLLLAFYSKSSNVWFLSAFLEHKSYNASNSFL